MADIKVLIDVVGEQDMVKAINTASRMELEYKKLDRQFNKSKLTAQQYAKGVQQLDAKYDALIATTKQLTTVTKQAGAAQQIVGKRANRAGVLAQQAGYQFGDFAVQVQSGTNVMVAAGQQATQLVGTFSMLARTTKGIMAFSALGVLIPVLTGIGAYLMRAGEAAKDLGANLDALTDAVSTYKQAATLAAMSTEDLADRFGAAGERAGEVGSFLKQWAEIRAVEALNTSVSNLANTFGDMGGQVIEVTDQTRSLAESIMGVGVESFTQRQLSSIIELSGRFKTTTQEAYKITEVLRNFSEASSIDEQVSAALELNRQFVEIFGSASKIPEELRAVAEQAGLIAIQASEMQTEVWSAEDAARALSDAISQMDFSGAQEGARGLLGLLNSSFLVAQALAESRIRMGGRDSTEVASLAGQYSLYGQGRQEAENLTQAGLVGRVIPLPKTPPVGGGGGGGGGTSFDQATYLKSLQEEANFKRSLVGLGEAEITELERRREIVERMTADGQTLNAADEERIKKILETEAATRRAIVAEEQRQATFDMVSGHIENAFMTMVDGSKSVEDAFKGMLRNILLEVYKQAVAKPIVSGIMGFLGFKDGGAFSGGNVIPFANGGVVSSATMFPMAGNQTGVMGEAGPEAIMPLKRGANGKLGVQVQGGGENVVIHQNFNFQANGDDTVKKLIAQAAPQIANMTKKSMMDDRRRGGQMKTTFG